MQKVRFSILGLALCISHASAATLDVTVTDRTGRPARDAVVYLESSASESIPTHLPQQAIIDQRHETFLPLDVVVRKGGRVVFTNNDTTKHQVYSFSPIRQFQFVINQGETAPPIDFPVSGVAAIGCNIHDQMIAYVFVGDAPYAAITDTQGKAVVVDIHPGKYRVGLWHPQMGPDPAPPVGEVDIAGTTHFAKTLPFTIAPLRTAMHMHMDY